MKPKTSRIDAAVLQQAEHQALDEDASYFGIRFAYGAALGHTKPTFLKGDRKVHAARMGQLLLELERHGWRHPDRVYCPTCGSSAAPRMSLPCTCAKERASESRPDPAKVVRVKSRVKKLLQRPRATRR